MNAMQKAAMPDCREKCGRRVKSKRSKLCSICFLKQAAQTGAHSAGNAAGNPGNAGNADAAGTPDNAGNQTSGPAKKRAGKRSGLKRSAKVALVVKKEWLDRILAGEKDWEIRGEKTTRLNCWIHFAESKAGGKLVGRARVVACKHLAKSSFMKYVEHHCVTSLSDVKYKKIFAWVLEGAERFKRPFEYKHQQGAVKWVRV